jgi:cytochrome P450
VVKPSVVKHSPIWSAGEAGLDLADPFLYTGSHHLELWREARSRHPVAWTESALAGGFWSVTGHAEAQQVLALPEVFVSHQGMRLRSSPMAVAAAAGRMLVVSDGAEHRRLRAAHQGWFGSRALAALGPSFRCRLTERLTALMARGTPVEAVSELTAPAPVWVLFDLLGIPGEDAAELSGVMAEAFDDSDQGPEGEAARTAAHASVFNYFEGLIEERRARPGDDMISALVHAAPEGRPLTDEEILLNCDGLMNGGLETTPHALAGALLVVAQDREAWQRLKDDPTVTATAVEEILRWTSPALHAMRTATAPAQVGGAAISPGERVALWYPSCNRDERVFPEADTFRPDRRPNQHIGFGAGAHYCVGAALARLEVRTLLDTLVRHVTSVTLVGEVVRRPSNFLQGLARLDIALTPA